MDGQGRSHEFLDHQAPATIAEIRVQDSADGVALGRPEMQQAFVVLARNGVARLGEVNNAGAVFEHGRVPSAAKQALEQPREGFCRHSRHFFSRMGGACDG